MAATMEAMRKLRGTKRTCRSCEQRFYDLDRDPTVCPSCGASLPTASFERVEQASTGYQRSNWRSPKPDLVVVPADDKTTTLQIEDGGDATTPDEMADAGDADVLLEEDGDDDVTDLLTSDETGSETE